VKVEAKINRDSYHLWKICTYAFCLRSAGIFAIYWNNGKKIQSAAKGRCI